MSDKQKFLNHVRERISQARKCAAGAGRPAGKVRVDVESLEAIVEVAAYLIEGKAS